MSAARTNPVRWLERRVSNSQSTGADAIICALIRAARAEETQHLHLEGVVSVSKIHPDPAVVNLSLRRPFHACWYPIALSSDLAPGDVRGVPFLGGRVVVYRTERGAAQVRSAYCRHLGADLSVGQVIGETIRCPFHHWRYDGTGRCVDVPAGDPPPPAARLFAFPTAESLGIIWAFNGIEPSYPVPSFGDGPVALDTFRNPVTMKVASDTVFLNSFDIQHFRVVHKLGMDIDESVIDREPHRFSYAVDVTAPELGAVRQERTLWGVCAITIKSVRDGRDLYLLHALCPNEAARTSGFLANAIGPDPSGSKNASADAELLATLRGYSLRLIAEDAPIFDSIRFERGCLTRSDRFLTVGMEYLESFPETRPAAGLFD
jgi:nitrite reductase/ring-hydroxylating ferredoxin subunit